MALAGVVINLRWHGWNGNYHNTVYYDNYCWMINGWIGLKLLSIIAERIWFPTWIVLQMNDVGECYDAFVQNKK